MPVKLLVVCFKFKTSQPEYEQIASRLARRMSDVPGLRWKIWLINAAQGKAGGIYLFDDEHMAQTFLTGPILTGLRNHVALTCFALQQFDVLEAATLVTHGPVREGQQI